MSFTSARTAVANLQKQLSILEAELEDKPWLDKPQIFEPIDTKLMSWPAFDAVQSLVESCQVLESMFTPSRIKIVNLLCGIYDTDALYLVTQLKVADTIRDLEGDKQGSGITIEKLAEAVGTTSLKLDPIMGQLSNQYIFRQVSSGVYTNNRHSMTLLQDRKPNPAPYIEAVATETREAVAGTLQVLKDPKLNKSQKAGDNPFALTHPEAKGGFFDWFFNHANDQQKARNTYGPEWLITITIDGVKNDIPWGELGDIHVVDIGSGDGERMMKIGPAYPNIKKITFQDNDANVLAGTKKDFDTNWPKDLKTELEYQQSDYFEPFQPYPQATSGPLVFFMRAVLCDFDDQDIVRILEAVKPALEDRKSTTGAFILIHELFIPSAGTPSVDDPSLPQTGPGASLPRPGWRKTCHYTERQCTTVLSGAQRSMLQLVKLAEQAGYKVEAGYGHRTMVSTLRIALK